MSAPMLLLAGACEQSRALAAGRLAPGELLDAQLAALRAGQPELNCYLTACETPRAPSLPAAGPLWGSTFAVKDNIDVAGLPTHAGLRAWGGAPAPADAPVVARLAAAGMVCLGKLNMHPMALGATNHNPDFGPCRNPRSTDRTPGGSSGGSAAAVAAGLCGLALGTDTMGSVRLPAAYCGVIGFKPSHGLLPLQGVVPLSTLLDHVGVIARRVEDVACAMAALAPGAGWPPAGPGARAARPRVAALRDARAAGASPEVASAYDDALRALQAGTDWAIEPVGLDGLDFGVIRRGGLLLCEAELHALLRPLLQARPEALPADLLAMMRYIGGRSAADLGRALAQVGQAGECLDRATAGCDALLLPTTPQVAFPLDGPAPASQADFTAPANMNGAPAISLPAPVPRGALPAGLQIVGHRGHDAALLALGAQAEAALERWRPAH